MMTRSEIAKKAARSRAKMRAALGRVPTCPRCGTPRYGPSAYCRPCRADYQREYRAARKHSPEMDWKG